MGELSDQWQEKINSVNKLCSSQEEKVFSLLKRCEERIQSAIKRKENEIRNIRNIGLTDDAVRLHDDIEKAIDELRGVIRNHIDSESFLENLSFSTLHATLPDLAAAGVLWFADNELLWSIDSIFFDLVYLILASGWLPNDGFRLGASEFREEARLLLREAEIRSPSIRQSVLEKNHDFLSQQIDERSHQLFTMGSLFVPISFLIYTYAVTNAESARLLLGIPLMSASLACYLFWFIMYLRGGKLTQASYPLIHSIELLLQFSTHTSLNEIRKGHWLLKLKQQIFCYALFILVMLWVVFVWPLDHPSIKYPWPVDANSLTAVCLFGTLLTSISWEPTLRSRDLAKLAIIADFYFLPILLRVLTDLLQYFLPWGLVILVMAWTGWLLLLKLLRKIIHCLLGTK